MVKRKRTIIYFVRHADSLFIPNRERERGLSDRGKADVMRINEMLGHEEFDLFISSPYGRAIETIRGLATSANQEIVIVEELRERGIGTIPERGFMAAKKQVYEDFDFAYPEGESSHQAQQRAVKALKMILNTQSGKKIVIGTHGDIMTLMLNEFDKNYGYDFWSTSTMPDIYRTEFSGEDLERVERIWK